MDSITCPECGLTSFNPSDIREGYCGACHDWTSSGGLLPVQRLRDLAMIAEMELDAVEREINRKWPQS